MCKTRVKHMLASKKETINAIYGDDLKSILNKLGILEKISTHDAKCSICRKILNLDSISALYTIDGEPKLVCLKDICYNEALTKV